jgi:hypothetical protein
VTLLDINDNSPSLGTTTYTVPEGTEVGTAAVRFDLRDPDAAGPDAVRVVLLRAFGTLPTGETTLVWDWEHAGQLGYFPFNLSGDGRALIVAEEVDFETVVRFDVELGLFDPDNLTANVTARIDIIDVDDTAPQFPAGILTLRMSLGLAAGAVIGKLGVTDPDGIASTVSFSMDTSQWVSLPIALDARTGILSLTQELTDVRSLFLRRSSGRAREIDVRSLEPVPGRDFVEFLPVSATDAAGNVGRAKLKVWGPSLPLHSTGACLRPCLLLHGG